MHLFNCHWSGSSINIVITLQITFCFFCFGIWETVSTQQTIQHTRVIHFVVLSLPQVFKSLSDLSQGVTLGYKIQINQLPHASVTVYEHWLASGSWRHRQAETLVTNCLRPEHWQSWPDRIFSSPTHKISLPYKSGKPRALFLPKETYSLNVVGLMANE